MGRQCLKCGYIRQNTDDAPEYLCPKCGAVYEKVEEHLSKQKKTNPSQLKTRRKSSKNTGPIVLGVTALIIGLGFLLGAQKSNLNPFLTLALWATFWLGFALVISYATPSKILSIGGGFLGSSMLLAAMLNIAYPPEDFDNQHFPKKATKNLSKKEEPINYPVSAKNSSKNVITAEDFGARWPFTVSSGELVCKKPGAVIFIANGKRYAVNGLAMSDDRNVDINEIWKEDTESETAKALIERGLKPPKIGISAIISRGLELCP